MLNESSKILRNIETSVRSISSLHYIFIHEPSEMKKLQLKEAITKHCYKINQEIKEYSKSL